MSESLPRLSSCPNCGFYDHEGPCPIPKFLAVRCQKCGKYRAGLQETSTETIKVTCCKVTYLARVEAGVVVLEPLASRRAA